MTAGKNQCGALPDHRADRVEPASVDPFLLTDPARFSVIFDRYWPEIFRYCTARAGGAGEDVAAETFRIAFDQRDRFDLSRPSARPWLYGIATNLLRRHHRSTLRGRRVVERLHARVDAEAHDSGAATHRTVAHIVDHTAERAVERVDAEQVAPAMMEAVNRLKPADREIVLLFAWADLSYQEIADAVGLPIGTVRSKLNRARKKLQATLPTAEGGRP